MFWGLFKKKNGIVKNVDTTVNTSKMISCLCIDGVCLHEQGDIIKIDNKRYVVVDINRVINIPISGRIHDIKIGY